MSANRAASIRARLKQHADATAQDFNAILTRYGLERLIYRLSVSEQAPNFLLKGALLFALWFDQPHRPTRDIDLLGFGSDDPELSFVLSAPLRPMTALFSTSSPSRPWKPDWQKITAVSVLNWKRVLMAQE